MGRAVGWEEEEWNDYQKKKVSSGTRRQRMNWTFRSHISLFITIKECSLKVPTRSLLQSTNTWLEVTLTSFHNHRFSCLSKSTKCFCFFSEYTHEPFVNLSICSFVLRCIGVVNWRIGIVNQRVGLVNWRFGVVNCCRCNPGVRTQVSAVPSHQEKSGFPIYVPFPRLRKITSFLLCVLHWIDYSWPNGMTWSWFPSWFWSLRSHPRPFPFSHGALQASSLL